MVTLNNNLLSTGAYNDVTWSAATGRCGTRSIYQSNGLYGYIGETDALTFRDDNITPDLSKTPPINDNPFGSSGSYPPGRVLLRAAQGVPQAPRTSPRTCG